MLPALEATLADLGIDLRAQQNVELDLDERPNKDPRAFCSPIEVPGRVVLVMKPQGGPTTGGRSSTRPATPSTSRTRTPSLSPEERRLGDNAVTEGWAMLLEYLTTDPVWLEQRLDFPRPYEFAAEGAAQLLWIVRRYCAKLLYELEFHSTEDLATLQPRYVELLADAHEGRACRGRLPRRHRRRLLRLRVPPRLGLRGAAARVPPRALRQRLVLASRGRVRCCASSGPRARSRPPTSSSTRFPGEKLELAAVGDRIREALAAV